MIVHIYSKHIRTRFRCFKQRMKWTGLLKLIRQDNSNYNLRFVTHTLYIKIDQIMVA